MRNGETDMLLYTGGMPDFREGAPLRAFLRDVVLREDEAIATQHTQWGVHACCQLTTA